MTNTLDGVSSSRKRAARLASLERLEIGTLVIVAGPSGAGKSTFLDLLAKGSLPSSLMSQLPADCAAWFQTNGTKAIGKHAADFRLGETKRVDGALLHYDTLMPYDTEVVNYETDRSLALVHRAARIVIVNIRPGHDVLRAHLEERLICRHVPPFLARLLSRSATIRAGALFKRLPDLHQLTGNRLAPRRVRDRQRWNARYAALHSLYRRQDWLNAWYSKWDSYIKAAAGPRLLQVLDVTPDPDTPSPSFRLTGVRTAAA